MIAVARLGGLNLHPSLLPRWRGPDPLFWTFHAGDRVSGITVHELSPEFDAGRMVAQRPVDVELGCRLEELEERLATVGGEMLADAVRTRFGGSTASRVQDGASTWAPLPADEDWIIEPAWAAERAFRYARGVSRLGGPLRVRRLPGAEPEPVADAVTLRTDEGVTFIAPGVDGATTIDVRFGDGTVRFVTG
jgi:methionyl-tRNA formyltransferase